MASDDLIDLTDGSAETTQERTAENTGQSSFTSTKATETLEADVEALSVKDGDPKSSDAANERMRSPSPPPPPPKDEKYLDKTSMNKGKDPEKEAYEAEEKQAEQARKVEEYDEKQKAEGGAEADDDSRSEIQSIMEQFDEGHGLGMEEIMSPRLEVAGPMFGSPMQHPPRKSSLEPLARRSSTNIVSITERTNSVSGMPSPPVRKASSIYEPGHPSGSHIHFADSERTGSPRPPSLSLSLKSPPPAPEPEPELPFDFHRFLEQLRHRTADPVARFLRSFLMEFGKKQWMVHEQVKIIGDFLEFISKKMSQCEVWRTVSDAEFDNAREGMEKLVMNRLYTQTFSPAIPPPEPAQGRSKRKAEAGPGRRGQHQEDVERDQVLAQKVRIYGWVKEEHLDIKPVGDKGRKFLTLAQQELLKIKSYRAPRDKVICILNCCKVIFGFLRNAQSDESADAFIPLLIYVVLHANPENLVSNVQYILRFRNQDKLGGETGYYISSLMGAIQFIEGLDRTSLTVSDEEFEKNVEAAVSKIAERHAEEEEKERPPMLLSEKSSISRPEVTPRHSMEAERSLRRSGSTRRPGEPSEEADDNAAVSGLLRTIQKPLSSIGRIFSDEPPTQSSVRSGSPSQRLSPAPQVQRSSSDSARTSGETRRERSRDVRGDQLFAAEEAAARQASAEAAEAQKIQRAEHEVVVDTLAGMFPSLDREVIEDVVRMKEGRVGLAVDACLALSN